MYNRKLTDEQAIEIRASKEKGEYLAEKYGVSTSLISKIRRGKRRSGDIEGRPVVRGYQSSNLVGFSDRNDRDWFHQQNIHSVYIAERQDGSIKISISGNPWNEASILAKAGGKMISVYWVADRRLAFLVKKGAHNLLEKRRGNEDNFSVPVKFALNAVSISAEKRGVFLETHIAMIKRVEHERRHSLETMMKKMGLSTEIKKESATSSDAIRIDHTIRTLLEELGWHSVYIMKGETGRIKIGMSYQPTKRALQISQSTGEVVECVHAFWFKDEMTAHKVEQEALLACKEGGYTVRNEWVSGIDPQLAHSVVRDACVDLKIPGIDHRDFMQKIKSGDRSFISAIRDEIYEVEDGEFTPNSMKNPTYKNF